MSDPLPFSDEEAEEALDRHPRFWARFWKRLGLAMAIGLAALTVLGFLFLVAYSVVPGKVDADSLDSSLARSVGESSSGACSRGPNEEHWRCYTRRATKTIGCSPTCSLTTGYRVTVDGHCWNATTTRGERKTAEGCVRWRDNLRLWDRFFWWTDPFGGAD
ncbi:MAG: hypothetical protein EXQ70_03385 [Solirubrobacterales bacterium]|nr:hypothetical protein [Solirubrobacterales bacterium]